MNKTADEMFEELGYKIKNEEIRIVYIRSGIFVDGFIIFNLIDKVICAEMGHNQEPKDLEMQELQAINKKCQELGWLESEK